MMMRRYPTMKFLQISLIRKAECPQRSNIICAKYSCYKLRQNHPMSPPPNSPEDHPSSDRARHFIRTPSVGCPLEVYTEETRKLHGPSFSGNLQVLLASICCSTNKC